MSRTKKILIVLLLVFVIIQFIKPEKNVSAADSPNDIFAHYQAPDSTKQLIRTACYNCHSNNTTYPWYSKIQPVAWWLSDHIKDAKAELNFSEFATYTPKKGDHKMEEVVEMVEEEEMPLISYSIIHKNARITDAQRLAVTNWAKQIRVQIQPNIK